MISTDDGLRLHPHHWPASRPEAARGQVLIVHGLGEHAGRYGELAANLHQWGFAVRAYDQQGHGQSEGARGDMLSPGSLQADLCRVIDDTRQRPALAGTPLILLGHSMGGLVVARTLAEVNRDREKRAEPFGLADFMPLAHLEEDEAPAETGTAQDMFDQLNGVHK